MNLTLRDYQHEIINKIRAEYRHGAKAPLLQSPTGSGKTVMFAYITESAARKGNRVTILVHRQELLLQTSRALFDIGVQHGLIAPGHSMTTDNIQVASVQTLVRRLGFYPEPDLLIIDEAHHTAAGSWQKILEAYKNTKLLGVTATPVRLDGRGLGIHSGGHFDTLILGPSVNELVEQGYLSKPVVYAPPTNVDLTGLRKKFGDFVVGQLTERLDKPTITGSAVEHYIKICPGVPAIVFCSSVAHAEHVAAQFNEAGIAAESIDGTLQDWERKSRIEYLGKGRIKVLTSCDIISEGTDIPIVTTAILLRPTQSTGLYLQQVGRCLRPHENKPRAIILDHVGNAYRHGFPDYEREWTLDGENNGKRKSNGGRIEFVQCEKCYCIFSPGISKCPSCGFERVVEPREIEQVEGELKEVDDQEKRRIQVHLKREVGQARTKEQLEEIAKKRGYKPGWVNIMMKVRENREVVYDR